MMLSQADMIPKTLLPNCSGGEAQCPFEEEVLRLRQQVVTDPLTGLYNAGFFRESLEQELERSERSFTPTALLMLDLDHFKQVNDTHGHEVGNLVLMQVADLIRQNTRKLDIQCRYGGEEFSIILPSTEPMMAISVAKRLHQAVATTPVEIDNGELTVTASMGLAIYQAGNLGRIETLIKQADEQLYKAKNSGRNRLCYEFTAKGSDSAVSSDERAALNNLFGN